MTTLLINLAILLTSPSTHNPSNAPILALTLIQPLSSILSTSIPNGRDSESTYRALIASGTLLSLGQEVQEAAIIHDIATLAHKARKTFAGEERMRNLVTEVLAILPTRG